LVVQTLKGAVDVTEMAAVADSVAAALSILLPPHYHGTARQAQQQNTVADQ
jgi:hypothetical protein